MFSWLHETQSLLEPTAELLNATWPRSLAARTQALQRPPAPGSTLPRSLVLQQSGRVVAHCRLLPVHGDPHGVLIESVVVDATLRGQGLGRVIMEEAERRAVALGLTTAHLSTHDKEGFYARLGYVRSAPVDSLGALARFLVSWKSLCVCVCGEGGGGGVGFSLSCL